MKLVVTTDKSMEEDFDTVVMDPIEFNHLSVHPYIATAGFTEVQLDLSSKVDSAYVSELVRKIVVRPIYRDFNLSDDAILNLSYIYPDKAAALRIYSLKDKDKLVSLLSTLADTYDWRKYE